MHLRYEDDFLEFAVFVCSRSRAPGGAPALQTRRFHLERERLYLILDPDERNTAFFKLHLEWFREWGLERILLNAADEFPLLRTGLKQLVFRCARVKKDEGAELYVNSETGRAGVVAFRPERFERPAGLESFLRHEFMHVQDMLDHAFGYSPRLDLPAQNSAQQRLTRERYRLLWDITIDGRLARASAPAAASGGPLQQQHRADFDRAFGFWAETKRNEVFDGLWNDPHPRHTALLAIAADPRGIKAAHEPAPGAPCPLCGFSTFDWATAERVATASPAIHCEFPHWTPERGACRRCVEIFKVLSTQSVIVL
jgi:hypothetical protein